MSQASTMAYYPFGMLMPGKKSGAGETRFGFNGKEFENDINQGVYNFDARLYNSLTGTFYSVDPLWYLYPSQSPYIAFNSNPIIFKDPTGKGGELTVGESGQSGKMKMVIVIYSDDDCVDISKFEARLNKAIESYLGEDKNSFNIPVTTSSGTMTNESISTTFDISVEVRSIDEARNDADHNVDQNADISIYYFAVVYGESGGYQTGNSGILGEDASDETLMHEILNVLNNEHQHPDEGKSFFYAGGGKAGSYRQAQQKYRQTLTNEDLKKISDPDEDGKTISRKVPREKSKYGRINNRIYTNRQAKQVLNRKPVDQQ